MHYSNRCLLRRSTSRPGPTPVPPRATGERPPIAIPMLAPSVTPYLGVPILTNGNEPTFPRRRFDSNLSLRRLTITRVRFLRTVRTWHERIPLAHVPAKWTRFADKEHAPHKESRAHSRSDLSRTGSISAECALVGAVRSGCPDPKSAAIDVYRRGPRRAGAPMTLVGSICRSSMRSLVVVLALCCASA